MLRWPICKPQANCHSFITPPLWCFPDMSLALIRLLSSWEWRQKVFIPGHCTTFCQQGTLARVVLVWTRSGACPVPGLEDSAWGETPQWWRHLFSRKWRSAALRWRTLHPSLQSFPCLLGGRVISVSLWNQEQPHGLSSHHHRGRNAGVSSKENPKASHRSLLGRDTWPERGYLARLGAEWGPCGPRLEATCDHSVTSVLTDRCVPHTDCRRQQCAEPSGNKASPSGVLVRNEQCALCVFKWQEVWRFFKTSWMASVSGPGISLDSSSVSLGMFSGRQGGRGGEDLLGHFRVWGVRLLFCTGLWWMARGNQCRSIVGSLSPGAN